MDFEWLLHVHVGSLIVTISSGDIDNGRNYACLGAVHVCGKSLYLSLSFAVNLKLLLKKKSLKKVFLKDILKMIIHNAWKGIYSVTFKLM